MVGDQQMDIDAGKALGCKTALVTTGPQSPISSPKSPVPDTQSMNLKPGTLNPELQMPDYTAQNLLEAARWIVDNRE